jgi:SAM-dependent methyltransferase
LREVWARAWDIEYGTVPDSYRYYRCRGCDAISISPLPDSQLTTIYPPTYYSFASAESALGRQNPVTRVKAALDRRRFRSLLDRLKRPEVRVLDVGGGSGSVVESLLRASDRPASATVVDIDPASAERARRRGLEFFLGRFEDFPDDRAFDVVLMLNLLEHVANPREVLGKARSLLASDGLVWLQTPNYRSLDARIFRNHSWAGLHCPRHWVVFGEDGLRGVLAASGLEPVSFERTQAGSFWAASILGLAHRQPPEKRAARPLPQHPLYLPLAAFGAGLDFATKRIRRTSQVVVLARAAD